MSTGSIVSLAIGLWLAGSFPFAALIGTALRRSNKAERAAIDAMPSMRRAMRPPGH